MPRSALLFLTAALALASCRPKGPDANFEKAQQLFQQLYAADLDDAYGDPQMDTVVGLLKKVDRRSSDAQAAENLLGNIQRGREKLAKERAERTKAAPVDAPKPVVDIDPERILAAGAADAGMDAGGFDPYGSGGSIAEINARTGGCLSAWEPFSEQVTNVRGTVYRVVQTPACSDKLAGFGGQAVLVVDGKIYRRIADPNPPPPPRAPAQPDAGPPPAARRAPPGGGADAGEPQYEYYVPGAPRPGATPPAGEPPR